MPGAGMAVMKKKVRKKLSKYLRRLVKQQGVEMTMALVSGIVSSLAADMKPRVRKAKVAEAAKPPARTIVIRKRAAR